MRSTVVVILKSSTSKERRNPNFPAKPVGSILIPIGAAVSGPRTS